MPFFYIPARTQIPLTQKREPLFKETLFPYIPALAVTYKDLTHLFPAGVSRNISNPNAITPNIPYKTYAASMPILIYEILSNHRLPAGVNKNIRIPAPIIPNIPYNTIAELIVTCLMI